MEKYLEVLPKGAELHNGKRKYKVEEVLGTGGFGITYKVSSTVMVDNVPINTFFAMKEYFLSSCYRDEDNVTMLFSPTMKIEVEQSLNDFITEAKRLNTLGHKSDNIVKVNEVFKENGTAYYIMEYLEGGNLQEYVRKNGALSESEAISIITSIAYAVEALHAERILHLDIKPENIVLKKDREKDIEYPVLIDFGLVKHFDSKGRPTTRVAAKGASDGFAPMEQYTTIDSFAPTLDVYALGATLYYLLKGKNPPKAFDIESLTVIKETLPPSVSETTKNAVVCAMAKSKFERTPTVVAFLSSLDNTRYINPIKETTKTTLFKNRESQEINKIKWIVGFEVVTIIVILMLINNRQIGKNENSTVSPSNFNFSIEDTIMYNKPILKGTAKEIENDIEGMNVPDCPENKNSQKASNVISNTHKVEQDKKSPNSNKEKSNVIPNTDKIEEKVIHADMLEEKLD